MNEKTTPTLRQKALRALILSTLFFAFGLVPAKAETITLYTEEYPPYNFYGKDKKLEGISIDIVRQIFAEAQISYKIRLMPWPRTYSEAMRDTKGLIFSLTRTESREPKFDWLALLARPEFYLFAHKDDHRIVTFVAIKNGDFTAVCVVSDSSCSILRKAGFPEDRIFKRGDSGQGETMVKYGRVDLYLSTVHENHSEEKPSSHTHAYKPALHVSLGANLYLAAGLHVDQSLRTAVKDAYRRLVERGVLEGE